MARRFTSSPDPRGRAAPSGIVVGLDLSLRAAAACAIPLDWDCKIDRAWTGKCGRDLASDASPLDRIHRIDLVSSAIVAFVYDCVLRADGGNVWVFVEDYAFAQSTSHAREIAELGGVVKWRLFEMNMNLTPVPVVASRARKILLQKLPRKDVKAYVVANVKRLGGEVRHWTDDEIDAAVIANAGVMLSGGTAMTFEGK